MVRLAAIVFLFSQLSMVRAASVLIPMDASQKNHLKAYGVAFWVLKDGGEIDWLLNYRGGSFLITFSQSLATECKIRNVTFEVVSDVETNAILTRIGDPNVNMNVVRMEKAPRLAVYSPRSEIVADESDAVMSVLDFAEISYDIIYDEEILNDALLKYDWVHLHHEDFTGQHGRYLRRQSAIIEQKVQEVTAQKMGYTKVSQMKLDVAKRIKGYCASGGYLFAMCSGAETFDIALSAEGVDICESIYDGDGMDADAQAKLDFEKTFAFENFILEPGQSRRFSNINSASGGWYDENDGFFNLFVFSAKWDIIPSLLTQNHEHQIKEFIGQTTAFNKHVVKPAVMIMGESENSIRYIYGEVGKGFWTFYGGHDPESFPGRGRGLADLNLYPSSPGYRLILNNVLFPSAKKKKQKT